MRQENQTETENQEIPEWFDKHPLAEAYKQQKAAETLQHRLEAAERLEAVMAEIRAGFPEQEAALCSVLEDLKAAEKLVVALRAEAGQAYRDLQIAKADLDRKKQAIETQLFSTYDQRIDEAQSFFRDRLDDLRRPGKISTRPMGATRNLFTLTKEVRTESNYDAILEASAYCRDAIAKLESMKLLPEFPEAEIEALKQGVPSIDRYVEYCAERPLPKDGPISAAAPTDYEIQKLLARRV